MLKYASLKKKQQDEWHKFQEMKMATWGGGCGCDLGGHWPFSSSSLGVVTQWFGTLYTIQMFYAPISQKYIHWETSEVKNFEKHFKCVKKY